MLFPLYEIFRPSYVVFHPLFEVCHPSSVVCYSSYGALYPIIHCLLPCKLHGIKLGGMLPRLTTLPEMTSDVLYPSFAMNVGSLKVFGVTSGDQWVVHSVGLTRARLAGARYAVGDVIVFLDAHCEAQPDWLRPLLHRIKEAPHAVLIPIIDVIEASTFYYSVLSPVKFQVPRFFWFPSYFAFGFFWFILIPLSV